MAKQRRVVVRGFDLTTLNVTREGGVDGEWAVLDGDPDRLDHLTPAELCNCCGIELLPSGSKFSPFFCRPCHGRVSTLNRSAERCIIPIGRHSIMNGIFIRGGGHVPKEAEIEHFAAELNAMFGGIDRLREWAEEIIRLNFEASIDHKRDRVPLGEYLVLVERRVRLEAFRAMVDWWATASPTRPDRARLPTCGHAPNEVVRRRSVARSDNG